MDKKKMVENFSAVQTSALTNKFFNVNSTRNRENVKFINESL